MFRLRRALKRYHEAGSLNEQINLFGFLDEHVFLTKSGDIGIMLAVRGVDYECLSVGEIDQFTKRLESAFKTFDTKCRVYQYLFKRNHETIPYQTHENPVVNAAIANRVAYLKSKANSLYALNIYYVVLLESPQGKKALLSILATGTRDLRAAFKESLALLSTDRQVLLLGNEISRGQPNTDPDLKVFVVPKEESTIAGSLAPAKYVRAGEADAYKDELAQLRSQLAQEVQRAQTQAAAQVAQYKWTYPTNLRFDYAYDRKAKQAPYLVSEIYHDDSFTYVICAAQEKPTIYELKDKKPNLINFEYQNGVYVISKIVDNGYLVLGKKKLTFNRRTEGK